MVDFLQRAGSENVTNKFDRVILYGFVSNCIFLLWQVYKMGKNRSEDTGCRSPTLLLLSEAPPTDPGLLEPEPPERTEFPEDEWLVIKSRKSRPKDSRVNHSSFVMSLLR